jgi:cell division transport system ATP-binding protein
MIRFSNVGKTYPNGHDALSQLSFNVDQGEMCFLTGHSGAGKTTLLKLISLLERPSVGEIVVANQNLNYVVNKNIPKLRRKIGLIFQTPHLLPDRNIYENVALPLILEGYRFQEMARRIHAALDMVGLLDKEQDYPETLSCGEQQRINIARAIVSKPPLILADEPTGNLDPKLSREIFGLFEQFNQAGVTVLIATHDVSLIQTMSHRILTLDKGRLVENNA